MRTYWTSIEYKHEIENTLKGGFVYAFVQAKDARSAISKFTDELSSLNLKAIDIEYIKPYEPKLNWQTKEKTHHYLELYRAAKKSKNVIFDTFYAYEK